LDLLVFVISPTLLPLSLSAVVAACQLEQDIASFEFSHDTMIGERGITLSGGQKARVSLARAVYATRSQQQSRYGRTLVLLDDPLSAVDPGVGEKIFAQCIMGLLKDTTRVLVTHHLHFAQQADQVLVLGADGSVAGCGTYEALVARGLGLHEFAERNLAVGPEQQRRKFHDSEDEDDMDAADVHESKRVIAREARQHGGVALSTLMAYLAPIGSVWLFLFILALFAAVHVTRIITDWYLSEWMSKDAEARDSAAGFGIYAALFATFFAVVFAPTMLFGSATSATSRRLHAQLLGSVLAAPMRFFDTQPVGRLLNRFR
jgi:ABC-type multidrug transport system fused ATPase/permease subunit